MAAHAALAARVRVREAAISAGGAPVQVVTPAPRDTWQALLRSDPDALPTQSPGWLDRLCELTGGRDATRLYDFGGGRRLVMPLVRRGRGPLATEASYPPAWGFGGLVGGTPGVDEVRAVLADLRSSGAFSVRVRPNPLHAETWAAAMPDGITKLERRAHVIDLRGGFDAVWKNGFSSRARNHVRRAERAGVRVELHEDGDAVDVFYELFMRSVERWAERQNEPLALARWRARRRDPIEKLRSVALGLGGMSRLWLARVGDRPAAGILVLQGRNAHYTRGVMDVEVAGPARANYLLHRHAIEAACEGGCLSYHMGETGDSRSLAQFKEALGAEQRPYAEYVAERASLTSLDARLRRTVKRVLAVRDDG